MTGIVFDIKEFSLHDGPGARVTVFLKGCPLRCVWCHNPEGLSAQPQLMYKENVCTHCGMCLRGCTHEQCKAYGRCIMVCPNNCLSIAGTVYTEQQLADRLLPYRDFLSINGGGITFSGGEPMLQADFVCGTADILRDAGMHLAVQTSGYADADVFKKVVDKMDYIMMDIKLADSAAHKKYTGVHNEKILANFEYLKNSGREYVIRVPLIPGITDTEQNLCGISDIIQGSRCELLRYNKLAGAKYPMLGMEYKLTDIPNGKIDTSIFQNAKLC